MASYFISYDLRKPQRDYSRLYKRLEDWNALQILESVHLIKVDGSSCAAIRDDLKQHLDANDGLFVGALTGESAWSHLNCGDQNAKDKMTA